MIKVLSRNMLRFVVLILAQILIFNNIEINGYLTPYIYILFLILLPFETPGWVILLSGFFLGFIMDIFSETMGMHTAATTLAAYLRPIALRIFSPREGYETGSLPRIYYFGFGWFLRYTALSFTVLCRNVSVPKFLFYLFQSNSEFHLFDYADRRQSVFCL